LKAGIPVKMRVLGVMSGTSLDGLDLALCEFDLSEGKYRSSIEKARTIEYPDTWKRDLSRAKDLSSYNYFKFNRDYGHYIAQQVNAFLGTDEKPYAIASHGHTVFHQPALGFTTQIGCGATIAANTGTTTINDFRNLDVANGGQGAPLVPIGDKLLFAEYDSCLNIGGIANISFEKNAERIAFDICFANMALNYLAEQKGKSFDENGSMAASGKVQEDLLVTLNSTISLDKASLARELFEKDILPILHEENSRIEDKLATVCTYAGNQVANVLNQNGLKSVLITGGGAYNKYLVNCIKNNFKGQLVIPSDEVVQFKEALIFAFLGYLRLHEKANALRSVTGAKTDSVCGAVHLVNK
jgi:anhydro-N-acetylmuramic acid kinase